MIVGTQILRRESPRRQRRVGGETGDRVEVNLENEQTPRVQFIERDSVAFEPPPRFAARGVGFA